MSISGKNIIGNNESAKGSNTFYAKNPATQSDLETAFYEATSQEVDEAVILAKKAFDEYRSKSNEERAKFLEAIADNILALGDDLIQRCIQETALPEGRLTGERGRTMNQLKLFASVVREGSWVDARIDTAIPERLPAPKPDIRQMQIPIGACWDFWSQ